MRAGQQSENAPQPTAAEDHGAPQAGGPAQHAFRIFRGGWLTAWVGGESAHTGKVRGGDARPHEGGGQPRGRWEGRGRLAALQAQNHKLGRLRGTEHGRPRAFLGRCRRDH